MRIIRQKLFFDYGKFTNKADAEAIKEIRNARAKELMEMRKKMQEKMAKGNFQDPRVQESLMKVRDARYTNALNKTQDVIKNEINNKFGGRSGEVLTEYAKKNNVPQKTFLGKISKVIRQNPKTSLAVGGATVLAGGGLLYNSMKNKKKQASSKNSI